MCPALDYLVAHPFGRRTSSAQLRACRQRMRDTSQMLAPCLGPGPGGRTGPAWKNKIVAKWFTAAFARISQIHGAWHFWFLFVLFASLSVGCWPGQHGFALLVNITAKGLQQAINRFRPTAQFDRFFCVVFFFCIFFFGWNCTWWRLPLQEGDTYLAWKLVLYLK